ncbi:MAG: VRR-NUC domain-containing protein [Bryobacterales bacterium]|nr:VRR-NUC domain-containing protein [Bryobacterales bacterium]
MTSEKAIVKSILAYLNGLPGCLARKRWGGGMGVAGDPDIDACLCGRSLQLEVKRPGERPTPLQLKRLEEWRRAGAVVGVVTSVAATRALLENNSLLIRTNAPEPAYIVSEQSL